MDWGHAPNQQRHRGVHAKQWVIERLSALLLDALDALVKGVAMDRQAHGGLEGVAVFLKQRIKGFDQGKRLLARRLDQRAEGLLDEVVDQRAVQELPLNGRYFLDLGLLVPGSVTPPQNGFSAIPVRGA